MHMADALVSPAVGGVMLAASAAALGYSVCRSKRNDLIDNEKIPLMGVMSAFVFAGQMINFTIPGTGSSGHIGGGILLAALLGGCPGFISLAAVLVIQALFFADGGLLALGCNTWNMGFYACLLCYPLLFKPLVRNKCSAGRIMLASVLSAVVSLQLGAFSVVLETLISGVTALPFSAFAALMQPIHLAIGAVEGLVTGAVLIFVWKARPAMLEAAADTPDRPGAPVKRVLLFLAIAAALVAGGLSLVASSRPDGLEWSIAGVTGKEELESGDAAVYAQAEKAQQSTALMPDYALEGSENAAGTSVAGLVGGAVCLLVAGGAALIIARVKKKRKV